MDTKQPSAVVLSREQLYEEVWATSVVQLAKRFGISDVGLAKTCKRHQIPRPSLGYWAKKAVGKAPPRPPLPVVADASLQKITLSPSPPTPLRPVPAGDMAAPPSIPVTLSDPELKEALEQFRRTHADVKVPDALRAPLPIICATLAALRRAAKDKKRVIAHHASENLVSPQWTENEAHLNVQVGRDSIERAMRFLNTLLKALDSCGVRLVEIRDNYHRSSLLDIFKHRYRLGLYELTRREPHVPTPTEIAEHEKYSFKRIPKWDYFPKGQFSLTINAEMCHYSNRTWTDGKVRRVEDMIPEIVHDMLVEVEVERAKKQRALEESRRQARESQLRWDAERRRKEEQERVDALIHEVERWETSRRIRRYLRAVERTVLERHGNIDEGSELDRWLNWADSAAERLDPLAPRPQPTPGP